MAHGAGRVGGGRVLRPELAHLSRDYRSRVRESRAAICTDDWSIAATTGKGRSHAVTSPPVRGRCVPEAPADADPISDLGLNAAEARR